MTVEPEGDTNSEADERRAIGGVFPNPQLQPVRATPTVPLAPGVTPTPGPPLTLPVTGEANPTVWVWDIESLLLGVALGVVMTLTFWFGFDQKNVD